MDQQTMFQQILAEYQITDPRQVAIELIRVHMTKRALRSDQKQEQPTEKPIRYQTMRKVTEESLGYFYGDEERFEQFYQAGAELDLLSTVQALFKQERREIVLTPVYVIDYFAERLINPSIETILIPEAHQFLLGLSELLQVCLDKQVTLTAEENWLIVLLQLLYGAEPHVTIQKVSIYEPLEWAEEFDCILTLPAFGVKKEQETELFFTEESEGIAVQNLLDLLSEQGELLAIIPSRFTFSGGSFAKLRKWILQMTSLEALYRLPSHILQPYTRVKTYLIILSRRFRETISMGDLIVNKEGKLVLTHQKQLQQAFLHTREDWRMEVLANKWAVEPVASNPHKIKHRLKLGEVAELFRGKSIAKRDLKQGNIYVLNISNIEEGEIVWDHLETLRTEIRKVRRYELEEKDLVITCRGTLYKVGIIRQLPYYTIVSANLMVIRCHHEVVDSEYLKMFLESPVGKQMVQTFQRGTTVINLHPDDLAELPLFLPDREDQQRLVKQYRQELLIYQRAKKRWETVRQNLYQQL